MTLTTEHLTELTSRITNRLAEFGKLTTYMPDLSPGVVRIAYEVIAEWEDEQAALTIQNATLLGGIQDVHGPTGAVIAELGTVHNNGDGSAMFAYDGTPIHFRITLDDDEANMDRYLRGFNDGFDHAREQEPPADDDDPEPDRDTDAETGRQLFSELVRRQRAYDPGPLTDEQADVINRHNGVPGWRPGEEYDEPLTPHAAATLGPEHIVVNPVRPPHEVGLKPISTARAPLPDPDLARTSIAHAVANGSNGGAELARAISKPRTLAEVDATLRGGVVADEDDDPDRIPKRGRKHNVVNYEQMLAELQRQAMAGVMPSQADFNYSKPAVWPVASSLCTRFGASWDELRQAAGLKCNPKAERYAKATA